MRFGVKRISSMAISALVVLLIGLVLGRILFPNFSTRVDARQELLDLRSQLAAGQSRVEIKNIFSGGDYRFLKLVEASESLWIIQTPFQTGAVNWELRLSFNGDYLTAFHVRTADSKDRLPEGAPPDIEFGL